MLKSAAQVKFGQVILLDAYLILLFGCGFLVLLTAWLPMVLTRAPLSFPIVCVAIGAAISLCLRWVQFPIRGIM